MPYPIMGGEIVEVVIWQKLYSQVILNVLHYRTEGTTDDAKPVLQELATLLQGAGGSLVATMSLAQTTDVSYTDVTAQLIYPLRYARVSRTENTTMSGAGTAPALPPANSAVVTKRGDLAGRHSIGAFHLGGIPTGSTLSGELTTGYRGLVGDVGDILTEAITMDDVTFRPVMINRTNQAASTTVTGTTVQPQVRTMRRRRVGLGI